jgi:hypothetical protein
MRAPADGGSVRALECLLIFTELIFGGYDTNEIAET